MASSGLASKDMREKEKGEGPVDLAHLERFTFGDRALEQEVLGLFAHQSQAWIERLK
ncbi:hypothetical protein [Breoghania sp.]|uniref:hypothetical protein n=1 Tax=Breoghania sp. TaxID=2065378 RepID=UPI00261C9064|nr:hypothetical protein [Breoghania sp.]MDJ0932129.1 hypothetical protein [Breoghania sp.]